MEQALQAAFVMHHSTSSVSTRRVWRAEHVAEKASDNNALLGRSILLKALKYDVGSLVRAFSCMVREITTM